MSYFQTKLQWLCEELKERENREKSLRHQLMLCRQQLRNLTENKEAELQCLFEQIERQEQLLEEIHREKRGVLIALSLLFFFVYVHEILGLGEKYLVSLAFSFELQNFQMFLLSLSPVCLSSFLGLERELFLLENFSFSSYIPTVYISVYWPFANANQVSHVCSSLVKC